MGFLFDYVKLFVHECSICRCIFDSNSDEADSLVCPDCGACGKDDEIITTANTAI